MVVKRGTNKSMTCDWKEKKILFGALIFLIGLLRYLKIGWSEILMIVGALIILKGILMNK